MLTPLVERWAVEEDGVGMEEDAAISAHARACPHCMWDECQKQSEAGILSWDTALCRMSGEDIGLNFEYARCQGRKECKCQGVSVLGDGRRGKRACSWTTCSNMSAFVSAE